MANQETLMSYLQIPLTAIPINPSSLPYPKSTKHKYAAEQLQSVARSTRFNLESLLQQFSSLLGQIYLAPYPLQYEARNSLRSRIIEWISPRMRQSLRATFEYLERKMEGLTAVSFDDGHAAKPIGNSEPDHAFIEIEIAGLTGPNRSPGVMKLSCEWDIDIGRQPPRSREESEEYCLVPSRAGWYISSMDRVMGLSSLMLSWLFCGGRLARVILSSLRGSH